MECELCGKAATGKAKIEGTIIAVCADCAHFGPAVHEQPKAVKLPDRPAAKAPEEVFFVPDAGSRIKRAREAHNLTRDQLAAKIKEQVATIERIEKGMRPNRHVAEKLQRALDIQLFATLDAERTVFKPKQSEPMTLGDVVTVRKRKK